MSNLEDQLSQYFSALDRSDAEVAEPTYPMPGSSGRPGRRTLALVTTCVVVLVLVVVAGALAYRADDSAPTADSPPPAPEGWQVVTFGTVQFAVPGDWPVYDDNRCIDWSTDGVYLGPGPGVKCPETELTGTVVAAAQAGPGGDPRLPWHGSLNGLEAHVQEPTNPEGSAIYYIALVDAEVFMSIDLGPMSDRGVAKRILDSVAPAIEPTDR
jgi:hypothetical protein